ncbi:hypothetical protein LZ31DRAFT_2649 [Colletotrichum somersetense]|nr:hypothetical protein LZ31DRAFT_2649 [Colletotrichum somersetense]
MRPFLRAEPTHSFIHSFIHSSIRPLHKGRKGPWRYTYRFKPEKAGAVAHDGDADDDDDSDNQDDRRKPCRPGHFPQTARPNVPGWFFFFPADKSLHSSHPQPKTITGQPPYPTICNSRSTQRFQRIPGPTQLASLLPNCESKRSLKTAIHPRSRQCTR